VVFKPLLEEQTPSWNMALAWRQDREQPPVVRAFLSTSEPVIAQLQVRRQEQGKRRLDNDL
jgi:DNA-binding transcriptional LysR family regulator